MTATLSYRGDLMCELVHERSGTRIITDAPVDNKGRGSAFSPTDLVTAAAASCLITTLAIAAQERGWQFEGTSIEIKKEMTNAPRRIAAIRMVVHFPTQFSAADRETIERIAMNCPVFLSLHPEVVKDVVFNYGG